MDPRAKTVRRSGNEIDVEIVPGLPEVLICLRACNLTAAFARNLVASDRPHDSTICPSVLEL